MRFLEILIESPKDRVVFSHDDPPWRKGKKGVKSRVYNAAVHRVNNIGVMTVVHFQADLLEQVECLVQLYLDYLKTRPVEAPAILSKVSGSELEAFLE